MRARVALLNKLLTFSSFAKEVWMPHHHLRSPPWQSLPTRHVPCNGVKLWNVHNQILFKNRCTYFGQGWRQFGASFFRPRLRSLSWKASSRGRRRGSQQPSSFGPHRRTLLSLVTRHSFSFLPLNNKSGSLTNSPTTEAFFLPLSHLLEVRFERRHTHRFKDGIKSGGRQISRVASNSLPCFVLKACNRHFVSQPVQPSGFGRAKLAVSPTPSISYFSKIERFWMAVWWIRKPEFGWFSVQAIVDRIERCTSLPYRWIWESGRVREHNCTSSVDLLLTIITALPLNIRHEGTLIF